MSFDVPDVPRREPPVMLALAVLISLDSPRSGNTSPAIRRLCPEHSRGGFLHTSQEFAASATNGEHGQPGGLQVSVNLPAAHCSLNPCHHTREPCLTDYATAGNGYLSFFNQQQPYYWGLFPSHLLRETLKARCSTKGVTECLIRTCYLFTLHQLLQEKMVRLSLTEVSLKFSGRGVVPSPDYVLTRNNNNNRFLFEVYFLFFRFSNLCHNPCTPR